MENASLYVDMNCDEEEEIEFQEADVLAPTATTNLSPAYSFGSSATTPGTSLFGTIGNMLGISSSSAKPPSSPSYSPSSPSYSPSTVSSAPPQSNPYFQNTSKVPQFQQQKRVQRFRKANTNVLAIKLGTLNENVVVSTGDPVFCKCGAAYSALDVKKPTESKKESDTQKTDPAGEQKMDMDDSTKTTTSTSSKAKENEDDSQTWHCQFCDHITELMLEEEELPQTESLDYILEPANEKDANLSDSKNLIFCIDISGSMCVTTEVVGKHSLKGNENFLKLASSLNTDRADQWAPNERRDITYISRLQAVKAAVETQLETMAKEHPNRQVGLITFNSEVTIIGDGGSTPVIITGDKLYDYDSLIQIGNQQKFNRPIKEAKDSLLQKLHALEESGPTALGPALIAALGMAGQVKGSEIVICTDGLANVGIGSLDGLKTEDQKLEVTNLYKRIGTDAAEMGLTVSVISIEGTDCRMENLGIVSDMTNGEVNVVSALKIVNEFTSILSLPVIATNCSIKLILHSGLFVRSEDTLTKAEDKIDDSKKESVYHKDIGNVTSESAFTVEYGVKKMNNGEAEKETTDKSIIGRTTLPFQLQIRYSKLNGMKCIRIISQEQQITWDKAKAEREANVDILGLNAVQTTAKIAQEGSYTSARFHNYTHQNLMTRTVASSPTNVANANSYVSWGQKAAQLENELQTVQLQEQNEGLYLDDSASGTKEEIKITRGARRNDKTANLLWNATSKRKGFK